MPTITTYINSKHARVVQFTGHASYTGWSHNNKTTIEDMANLKENNLFILVDLSCWTGTYAYYKRASFSEDLLNLKNKGPICIFSSSGYTLLKNYNSITNYFLDNRGEKIGNVINNIKKELFNSGNMSLDDMHAYNLLGVPTLAY